MFSLNPNCVGIVRIKEWFRSLLNNIVSRSLDALVGKAMGLHFNRKNIPFRLLNFLLFEVLLLWA